MKRLDLVLDGGLACVVAPAGFGKTTAVRSWVLDHAQSSASGAGELRLPDDGSSPEDGEEGERYGDRAVLCRWWWHDATPDSQVEKFLPHTNPGTERDHLELPPGSLVDVLVVDDAHLLRPAVLAATVKWLHDHPSRARLVLISRWGLSREVSQARLPEPPIELRAEDLRFSLAESRELLHLRAGPISEGHEAALLERTSGWAAGLRLAAVGLEQVVRRSERNGDEPRVAAREFVSQLSGDDRAIADFLTVEVLSAMPHRDLAVLASVCGRRTGPLFAPLPPIMVDPAEVTVRTRHLGLRGQDAIEMLNRFAENELFVVVAGGRWRVHPLLVATVRGLVSTTPALITAAERGHAAAAQWHAAALRSVEALGEAIGSRRADLVADVLIEFGPELVFDPRTADGAMFTDAFDVLGPAWRSERPHLLPVSALRELVDGDTTGAVARVEDAGVLDREPAGARQAAVWGRARSDLAVARIWLARLGLGDIGEVLDQLGPRWCPEGPGTPPAPSEGLLRDCLLLTALGEAALCEGRFAEGASHLKAAMRLTGGSEQTLARSSLPLRAIDLRARGLAVLCGVGDRLAFERLAVGLEERDATASRSLAGSAVNPFTVVRLTRAFLAHLDGDEQRAILELARAEAGAADADPLFPVICAAARAWLALTTDDPAQATAALARLRVRSDGSAIPPWLGIVLWCADIAAAAADGALAETAVARAVTELEGIDVRAPGAAQVLALVAPLVAPGAAAGVAPEATPSADDGQDAAAEAARAALVAVGRSLLAMAVTPPTTAAGGPSGSDQVTAPRAKPGRSGGAGTAVRAKRAAPAERLAARGVRSAAVVALPEPLTPRELDVLQYLDGPAHYDNIAEELFLSRNTVKTHVKAVYRKLGVNGRVAAVKLARELGLLAER